MRFTSWFRVRSKQTPISRKTTSFLPAIEQLEDRLTPSTGGFNQPPVSMDNAVTLLEDTSYTFQLADFNFSDPANDPPDNFLNVIVANLPYSGTLTLNGQNVTQGQAISVTDIAANLFKFVPGANENGDAYTSFNFQVQDDGGYDAEDQDTSAPSTMTINVTPVNDAPTGADKTISVSENEVYQFAQSDFGFDDSKDNPAANSFFSVIISTLPEHGMLELNGIPVQQNDPISVEDLDAGSLSFTPELDAVGAPYDSFDFQVKDNGGVASGGVDIDATPRTLTLDVAVETQAEIEADLSSDYTALTGLITTSIPNQIALIYYGPNGTNGLYAGAYGNIISYVTDNPGLVSLVNDAVATATTAAAKSEGMMFRLEGIRAKMSDLSSQLQGLITDASTARDAYLPNTNSPGYINWNSLVTTLNGLKDRVDAVYPNASEDIPDNLDEGVVQTINNLNDLYESMATKVNAVNTNHLAMASTATYLDNYAAGYANGTVSAEQYLLKIGEFLGTNTTGTYFNWYTIARRDPADSESYDDDSFVGKADEAKTVLSIAFDTDNFATAGIEFMAESLESVVYQEEAFVYYLGSYLISLSVPSGDNSIVNLAGAYANLIDAGEALDTVFV